MNPVSQMQGFAAFLCLTLFPLIWVLNCCFGGNKQTEDVSLWPGNLKWESLTIFTHFMTYRSGFKTLKMNYFYTVFWINIVDCIKNVYHHNNLFHKRHSELSSGCSYNNMCTHLFYISLSTSVWCLSRHAPFGVYWDNRYTNDQPHTSSYSCFLPSHPQVTPKTPTRGKTTCD